MGSGHEFPINDYHLFQFFLDHLKPIDSEKPPHECHIPLFEGEKSSGINEEEIKLSKETEKVLVEASDLAFFDEEHIEIEKLIPILSQIDKKINDKKGKKIKASEGIEPLHLALNEIFAILCEISCNNSHKKKSTATIPEKSTAEEKTKTPTTSEKITEDNKGNTSLRHKLKIKLLEAIWPRFIRRSIQTLRSCDSRDMGTYKEDLGVTSLTKYFEEYSKFEELLFGADDYQREHILHVFRVYLLGIYLICNENFFNKTKDSSGNFSRINAFDMLKIDDYDVRNDTEAITNKVKRTKNPAETESEKHLEPPPIKHKEMKEPQKKALRKESDTDKRIKEKFAIWTMIALTHDLGYPLEKLDKINQRVSSMMKYFGVSNFYGLRFTLPLQGQFLNDYILKFISSKLKINKTNSEFYPQIQSKFYTKFSNAFERLSHGIISCILLMKNLTYFLESDYAFADSISGLKEEDPCQFLIRREILRAIASHDCDDIYQIHADTFSFLLIICDELQEWDRPFAKDRGSQQADSRVCIQSFTPTKIEFTIEINQSQTDFMEFLRRKVKKFVRLFRSGVDSGKRNFDFIMYIVKQLKTKSLLDSQVSQHYVDIMNIDKISGLRVEFPEPKDQPEYPGPNFIAIIADQTIAKKIKPQELLQLD